MNEEKKEYSVKGTVTIGTDEYRDLIEDCIELKNELSVTRSEKSDYCWKNHKNEERVKELEKELETYKAFVADGRHDSFLLWKLEDMEGESEE